MAHFAELKAMTDPTGFTSDSHQVVQRVVVVGNDVVPSDMHVDGETWCINFFNGGIWKQTSYNHNFRKEYAGIGFTYDAAKDKFIRPQPYASWSLDSDDNWQPPVAEPEGEHRQYTHPENGVEDYSHIRWDEENLRWIAMTHDNPPVEYVWNPDTSTYTAL